MVVTTGYLERFEIRQDFQSDGLSNVRIEITLAARATPVADRTTLTFVGVTELRFGDHNSGLALGCRLVLSTEDIRPAGLEACSFRVVNQEQDLPLSFYCRAFFVGGQSS